MPESRIVDRIASGVVFGGDSQRTFQQLVAAEVEARGGLVEIGGETCFDRGILADVMDDVGAAAAQTIQIATLLLPRPERRELRAKISEHFADCARRVRALEIGHHA